MKDLHRELIEHIAESDDELMNKFFEQGSLSEEEFRAGIHTAVQKELFIPLFCASAENNVGVARLMDFIAKYGSSPVDRAKVKAIQRRRRGGGGGADVARSGGLHFQDHVRGAFRRTVVFPPLCRLGFARAWICSTPTARPMNGSARFLCSTARTAKRSTRSAPATSARSSNSRSRTPATRCARPKSP